jgi:hypothetical protein
VRADVDVHVNVNVDVDGVADVDDHGHDAERDAVAGHGAVAEDDVGHVDGSEAGRTGTSLARIPYQRGIQLLERMVAMLTKLCR